MKIPVFTCHHPIMCLLPAFLSAVSAILTSLLCLLSLSSHAWVCQCEARSLPQQNRHYPARLPILVAPAQKPSGTKSAGAVVVSVQQPAVLDPILFCALWVKWKHRTPRSTAKQPPSAVCPQLLRAEQEPPPHLFGDAQVGRAVVRLNPPSAGGTSSLRGRFRSYA